MLKDGILRLFGKRPPAKKPERSRRRGKKSRTTRLIKKEVDLIVESIDLARPGGDMHCVTVSRWPGKEACKILDEKHGISCVRRAMGDDKMKYITFMKNRGMDA